MTKRFINSGVLITMDLVFLAWYDVCGAEQYLANVPQDSKGSDFHERMQKMGAADY